MYTKDIIDVNYGIHVVFSTIPNQVDINFEEKIEDYYFKEYKKSNWSLMPISFL